MARLNKKRYAIIGGVSIVALTGGIAFAYWTSTGSDTDTATTGNENAWTVLIDTSSISNGTLTPAGPTDTIDFTVTNNETGTKRITGETVSVAVTTQGVNTGGPACSAADFDLTALTVPHTDVAATGSVAGSFKVQMKNLNQNQDACKGALLTYTVSIT